MQCKSIIFIFAYATGLMASPFTEPQHPTNILTRNNYVEHYREPVANGTLVYLGHASDAANGIPTTLPRARKAEARGSCATTTAPTCSTKHMARSDTCAQLVKELQGNSQIVVPKSPRQICYEGAGGGFNEYCCVSWGTKVPNLVKSDLAGYVNTSK